uniref:Uncharacterized protein n=1 Tax=Arundo donax TaxID=35708 RepID=A0A0A8YM15_ARUDO
MSPSLYSLATEKSCTYLLRLWPSLNLSYTILQIEVKLVTK